MPKTSTASRGLFSDEEYAQMREFFRARPALAPTPIRQLNGLAGQLGISALTIKDETARFGLNAFKILGARFAIEQLMTTGRLRPGDTVICASEGNHGRAVARAARDAGCKARVYVAHDVAQARVDAIAGEGADVIRVAGSYDDAVRVLQSDAAAHGWTIVSDTAWEGYEDIPRLIMQGYSRMMDEAFGDQGTGIRDQGSGTGAQKDVDILFVQGGVGGLLCGVASWCARYRPGIRVVCVEPTSSACLQASARAGHPVAASGPLNTAMTGLRNREVSTTAFAAVRDIVQAFIAIDDAWAEDAMRALQAAGVRAGASGAAALGGLLAIARDPSMASVKSHLGLGETSRVMAIVSEGVTDRAHWSSVVEAA